MKYPNFDVLDARTRITEALKQVSQVESWEANPDPNKTEPIRMLHPVLYTKVESVSRSGMSRTISVYAIINNEPWNISGYVAKIIGWPIERKWLSIKVSGCGMDMCFHTIETLSRALFNQGYKIHKRDL